MATINTVTGEVSSDALGHVLPHEHLFGNLQRELRAAGVIHAPDWAAQMVSDFVAEGGRTIVDVTPAEMAHGGSPDPAGIFTEDYPDVEDLHTRPASNVLELEKLARSFEVNIVLGTGHYRDPYLDRSWFDRNSAKRIGQLMVEDLTVGFPGTSVKAGIIGEIGAENWYMTAAEERSFRAAAYAHRETGATITTHAARWPVGIPQLEVLMSEDVDPAAVIIGHADTVMVDDYRLAIAKMGAWVQLDTFFVCQANGSVVEPEIFSRVAMIMKLVRAGHLDRILVSHDVAFRNAMPDLGGSGFTFITRVLRERLLKEGLDHGEVAQILEKNPADAICGIDR